MKDFIVAVVGAALSVALTFAAFVVGGAFGVSVGREAVQREAIERGAGRWTIDPATGAKTFAWTAREKE